MTPTVESLWANFASQLRGFIRSRVRDHAAAEDILQEAFLKIHRHLPTLRSDQKVEAWIWRIVRNAIADHFRRDRPSDRLPDDVELPVEPAADPPDLACCLRKFIDQLAPAHREALLLTEWDGLAQTDLAKRLGLSASGAKSRVQRGRTELKELLAACCRFELDRRGGIIEMTPREQDCAGDCRARRRG